MVDWGAGIDDGLGAHRADLDVGDQQSVDDSQRDHREVVTRVLAV